MSHWVRTAAAAVFVVACASNEPAEHNDPDGGSGGSASGAGGSGAAGGSSGSGAVGGSSGSGAAGGSGGSTAAGAAGAGTGAVGGSGGSAAAGAAGAGTGGSGAETACPDFPVFERACWDDAWCVVAFHQIDCCGTRIATGIFHTAVATFDAAEAACVATYGVCDCAARPTMTDTDQTTSDESVIAVQCRSGVCTTYVP